MKKIILFFIIFWMNMSLDIHCLPFYKISKINKEISFACREIEEVDYDTFEEFEPFSPYAKDKNNVYYREKIIKNADLKTFGIIEGSSENIVSKYAYDKNTIYLYGEKIKGANLKTFEVLDPMLARDKNDFYLYGVKLNVDIKTFEYTLEKGYFKGKDKNRTYNNSCEIWVGTCIKNIN